MEQALSNPKNVGNKAEIKVISARPFVRCARHGAADNSVRTVSQGHLHTYRFCDGVWIFHLEQVEYTPDAQRKMNQITLDSVKIIASDSSL